jgi:glutaredoxin
VKRLLVIIMVLVVALAGCKKKGGAATADDPAITVRDSTEGLLLTWIDDKGDFHVEQRVTDVPMMGRDAVRVVDPTKDEGTHEGRVFVVDLRQANKDGTYPVQTMSRDDFQHIAEKRRELSGPTLATAGSSSAGANANPSATATGPIADNGNGTGLDQGRPTVIIYGAEWCGPCHQAASYLKRKGIPFVEKDIEKDPQAAREMQSKLKSAGIRTGSIPVIDVRGKVMVGFNPNSVDEALGHAT